MAKTKTSKARTSDGSGKTKSGNKKTNPGAYRRFISERTQYYKDHRPDVASSDRQAEIRAEWKDSEENPANWSDNHSG